MKLHNGNLIVLRTSNPCPKSWAGPWFKFGNPGNLSGQANWKMLASYIGGETYKEVKAHFKCLRGIK